MMVAEAKSRDASKGVTYKVVSLIKRKQGITKEEFRERYLGHTKMVEKYVGNFYEEYRINFLDPFTDMEQPGSGDSPPEESPADWDTITEMVFADREQALAGLAIASDPEIAKVIAEDESGFIDQKAVRSYECDVLTVR
jgi:hypothetical protein